MIYSSSAATSRPMIDPLPYTPIPAHPHCHHSSIPTFAVPSSLGVGKAQSSFDSSAGFGPRICQKSFCLAVAYPVP